MTQQAITIVNATPLAVVSPYNRAFAYHARMAGGTWTGQVWEFEKGYTVESMTQVVTKFYPGLPVVVADAIPVPEAIPDHGHVGKVGEKLTVRVTISKVSDFTGGFGPTRCHTMVDADGHVFTWFASEARYEVGQVVTLVGKVKKHDAYKGVSQTVLTRCKKV
jgi:hypothetical protein